MSVNIKLLESASNLKRVVSKNLGFELSAEKANQICACLQQGRLYFEAAAGAAWQIKPLLVYYGVAAFPIAVALTRTKQKLESLPQNHGVSDVSVWGQACFIDLPIPNSAVKPSSADNFSS